MTDDLKTLALAVVRAQAHHQSLGHRQIAGMTDDELAELVIERQRALTAMVRAENALAQAVRKEPA
jgi:hypothetical protein